MEQCINEPTVMNLLSAFKYLGRIILDKFSGTTHCITRSLIWKFGIEELVAFHLQSVITITFELQSKTIAIVLLFYRFANKSSVYTQLSSCQLTARHELCKCKSFFSGCINEHSNNFLMNHNLYLHYVISFELFTFINNLI